jgi:hypothetical protein
MHFVGLNCRTLTHYVCWRPLHYPCCDLVLEKTSHSYVVDLTSIFNTFNFFQHFQDLDCLNWFDLIPNWTTKMGIIYLLSNHPDPLLISSCIHLILCLIIPTSKEFHLSNNPLNTSDQINRILTIFQLKQELYTQH